MICDFLEGQVSDMLEDDYLKIVICVFFMEVRFLDQKKFCDWVKFYVDDVIFWVLVWKDEYEMMFNLNCEFLMIYYENLYGLSD